MAGSTLAGIVRTWNERLAPPRSNLRISFRSSLSAGCRESLSRAPKPILPSTWKQRRVELRKRRSIFLFFSESGRVTSKAGDERMGSERIDKQPELELVARGRHYDRIRKFAAHWPYIRVCVSARPSCIFDISAKGVRRRGIPEMERDLLA